MEKINESVELVGKEFDEKYNNCNNAEELDSLRVEFSGKKGKLTEIMAMLRDVANEKKCFKTKN